MRVALWRAIHVEVDPLPHVLDDKVGLRMVDPDQEWRSRPDMEPSCTKPFRASIVARARFIEDPLTERVGHGINQYVILGAGLDTFAQRRPEMASEPRIFEVDRARPQACKRQRLIETGYGIPEWLRCALFRSTSRRGIIGGRGLQPRDSTLASRRWWPRVASACISPRRQSWARCARSRHSLQDPRSP